MARRLFERRRRPRSCSFGHLSTVILFGTFLLAAPVSGALDNQDERELRPLQKMSRINKRETVLPGSYVVLLHDFSHLQAILADYGLKPFEIYRYTLKGFAVEHLSESSMYELLKDPRVELVAEDGLLDDEQDQQEPPVRIQSPAVWNLDRLDGNGGDMVYEYRYDGTGVDVYIIDSGIRATNSEFEDRVVPDCFDDVGPCNTDTVSHGTHVAGIVGGRRFGVAKGVTLHDVRIRDNEDILRWAYLYAGFDYVVAEQRRNPNRKLIANVSYSGSTYDVADRAAQEVVNAGVILIAAAGNQNEDSCNRSPARVPGVIAVGSMAEGDVRADSSNAGACISIWAPGRDIMAAGIADDNAVLTKSGTSMAAPMVSGALALYLSAGWTLENLLADAEYVDALADDVTTGRLLSLRRLIEGGTRSPVQTSIEPPAIPTTSTPTTVPSNLSIPVPTETSRPTFSPSAPPIAFNQPTVFSTFPPRPTRNPTGVPSNLPTVAPTVTATLNPITSSEPTNSGVPSTLPTLSPSQSHVPSRSQAPSVSMSPSVSQAPSSSLKPSESPSTSQYPSFQPSASLAPSVSDAPTVDPTGLPRAGGGGLAEPTSEPTVAPTPPLQRAASTDVPSFLVNNDFSASSSAWSVSLSNVVLLAALLAWGFFLV